MKLETKFWSAKNEADDDNKFLFLKKLKYRRQSEITLAVRCGMQNHVVAPYYVVSKSSWRWNTVLTYFF